MDVTRDAQTASSPPTLDSGLRCPVCEYNLTGVAEDRCPECGTPFDRDQLLAILAGAPAPIPIWDDHSRNLVRRFTYMCMFAWFTPTRLVAMLPAHYSARSARRFRWLVVALAAGAAAPVLLYMSGPTESAVILVVCGVPFLVAIEATEHMVAAAAANMLPFKGRSAGVQNGVAYEWWRGLFGFLRSFSLLPVAMASCAVLLEVPPSRLNKLLSVTALWWYLNVAIVLLCHRGSAWAKAFLVAFVPAVCFVAALVGWAVMMLLLVILIALGMVEGF